MVEIEELSARHAAAAMALCCCVLCYLFRSLSLLAHTPPLCRSRPASRGSILPLLTPCNLACHQSYQKHPLLINKGGMSAAGVTAVCTDVGRSSFSCHLATDLKGLQAGVLWFPRTSPQICVSGSFFLTAPWIAALQWSAFRITLACHPSPQPPSPPRPLLLQLQLRRLPLLLRVPAHLGLRLPTTSCIAGLTVVSLERVPLNLWSR